MTSVIPLATTMVAASCLNASTATKTHKDVVRCSLEESLQCVASYWIYALITPTLLLFGTVGNALIVVVMRQIRVSEFGTYMSSIAITDILVLWVTLPRHFIRWMWLVDIRQHNQWTCRTMRYLQFSLMHVSAWLLVVVSVERWLCLYYPFRFNSYKQRFRKNTRAAIAGAAVSLFHFIWNLHIFWTLGEKQESACKVNVCGYPTPAVAHYWQRVHTWVDLTKLSLLPFAIMLAINVALIVRLRQRAQAKREQRSANLTSAGSGDDNEHCELNITKTGSSSGTVAVSQCEGLKVRRKRAHHSDGKTAMLLSVSFFYVVMTVPSFISTALEQAKLSTPLVDSITTMLFYANNSFNFLLFCLSDSAFRQHFVRTLRSWATLKPCLKMIRKQKQQVESMNASGTTGTSGSTGLPQTTLTLAVNCAPQASPSFSWRETGTSAQR